MPEKPTFKQFTDYRYGDRGGYDGLVKLFTAEVPYEQKVANAKEQYRISTSTVVKFYKQIRSELRV